VLGEGPFRYGGATATRGLFYNLPKRQGPLTNSEVIVQIFGPEMLYVIRRKKFSGSF